MRIKSGLLFLPLLALMAALPISAADICGSVIGNVVQNCGFESGDFTGWTLSGNLEGGAQGNYFGVTSGFQNSGTYSAYIGVQGGGGTAVGSLGPFLNLSQALPVTSNEYYQISFYLEDSAPASAGYEQYFAAEINGRQLAALHNPTDPAVIGSYQKFSYVISPIPSAAGTAELSFFFQNDSSYWYLDDVSAVPVGATPEPASAALLVPALAAIYLIFRRRVREL